MAEHQQIPNKYQQEGDNVARCPYCGSPSVVAYRKPWNHGLAILGFFFFGIGVLLGFVGKGGYRRCLNCNKHWK